MLADNNVRGVAKGSSITGSGRGRRSGDFEGSQLWLFISQRRDRENVEKGLTQQGRQHMHKHSWNPFADGCLTPSLIYLQEGQGWKGGGGVGLGVEQGIDSAFNSIPKRNIAF